MEKEENSKYKQDAGREKNCTHFLVHNVQC